VSCGLQLSILACIRKVDGSASRFSCACAGVSHSGSRKSDDHGDERIGSE
jgi:hypothetical protein